MKRWVISVLLILLMGCSVPHVIETPNYQEEDAATITFKREGFFGGCGGEAYLLIDGIVVSNLFCREEKTFTIKPGTYITQVAFMMTYGKIQKYEFKSNRKYLILFDEDQGAIKDVTLGKEKK